MAYTFGTLITRTAIANLLSHLLTPYKLSQCTEVPFSFIKIFSSKVLSHVCLIRGSAERCDTQRLNKAVHGLGRRAIICICDGGRGRVRE